MSHNKTTEDILCLKKRGILEGVLCFLAEKTWAVLISKSEVEININIFLATTICHDETDCQQSSTAKKYYVGSHVYKSVLCYISRDGSDSQGTSVI